MRRERPQILVTNDDGVYAKGLQELVLALKDIGDITVVAPDGPRSGASSAITSETPLRYSYISSEPGVSSYSCNGTPADCVKLALNHIVTELPDIVVAGINHGGNQSVCVNYSGTLGAAKEAAIFKIPALAVSLIDGKQESDFLHCCRFARSICRQILREGLPKGIFLNLNVPDIPEPKGMKVCTQADGKFYDEFVKQTDPRGGEIYWLSGELKSHEPHNEATDMYVVAQGYASLVPCTLDVTAYESLNSIKHWEL